MQATIASTDAELVPFWSALIRDRRMALGLGFTSGMPFLLTYSTQSAWLTDAGVPLATIGLLSELTLAYKFKFVWAPFLDQYDPLATWGLRGWCPSIAIGHIVVTGRCIGSRSRTAATPPMGASKNPSDDELYAVAHGLGIAPRSTGRWRQ
jgi:hypothetical protein